MIDLGQVKPLTRDFQVNLFMSQIIKVEIFNMFKS